ncbi:MAG: NAD(P)H-hydrate epimerase, partial [Rhabdochlamydiaceae bacterium]
CLLLGMNEKKKMLYGLVTAEKRIPISAAEMREKEVRGVEFGITKMLMMENAGSALARFVTCAFFEDKVMKKILLVAGTGNNGGDTFVAARHLAHWNNEFSLSLVLVGKETDIRAEEALTNWKILKRVDSINKLILDSPDKTNLLTELISSSHVIIVGISGTGFKGSPHELQAKVIELINRSKGAKKLISVDIPSGMNADSGNFEAAVRSDYTITMDSPKVGLLASERARQICGEILVANIGLPC